MKILKSLAMCFVMLSVTACSLFPMLNKDVASASELAPDATAQAQLENAQRADAMIAQDFVNIMVQIEDLSPGSTVLNFGLIEAPNLETAGMIGGNFATSLRAAVAKSGYAVQTVENSTSPNYVSYSVTQLENAEEGDTYTYDLSVGDVDFRRVYRPLANGGVEPFRAMLVRGADAAGLETDDSVFDTVIDDTEGAPGDMDGGLLAQAPQPKNLGPASSSFDSPVERNDVERRQPFDSTSTFDSNSTTTSEFDIPETPQTPVVPEKDNVETIVVAKTIPDTETVTVANNSDGYQTIRKLNIAVSGESNYQNLLADKQNVSEEILIFGDDSYVLGARNKKILGEMMGTFNPETDVISVVGCSTGITKIENGNAALAIGRANRVKEALLYSGVPHDKIYDEGCWSPTPNSTPFPNRGVVITVKRNVNNG